MKREDRPVVISRKGNYQILTNTSLLIGVPKVRTICQRYMTAEDVIKKGIIAGKNGLNLILDKGNIIFFSINLFS